MTKFMLNWVEHGVFYHLMHWTSICLFCQQISLNLQKWTKSFYELLLYPSHNLPHDVAYNHLLVQGMVNEKELESFINLLMPSGHFYLFFFFETFSLLVPFSFKVISGLFIFNSFSPDKIFCEVWSGYQLFVWLFKDTRH